MKSTPEEVSNAWDKFERARNEYHAGQKELWEKMDAAFKEYQEARSRL